MNDELAASADAAYAAEMSAAAASSTGKGGLATEGHSLNPTTRAAVELARQRIPPFASMRRLSAASVADLAAEAFPKPPTAPMQPKPKKPKKQKGKEGEDQGCSY